MTVEIADDIEERLLHLAAKQGRGVGRLVEDAIQDYLISTAITDVTLAEVGETQLALIGELTGVSEWAEEAQ